MIKKEQIKSNFSQALKNCEKSLQEIADITGKSYRSIKSYVDKKSMPNIKDFSNIVKLLNLNVYEILDVHIKTKK